MGNKDRGSNTHGHGSSKKNRGAGSRGGRGKAGMGKKAKHKKQTAQGQADGKYLGGKGFQRPKSVSSEQTGINLKYIDQNIDSFVEEGHAEKDGDSYVFNAEEAGYDKVLGGGRLTRDIDIKAQKFSSSAEEKIADNGNDAIELED
jgi:large subunit ribosomal protein L15